MVQLQLLCLEKRSVAAEKRSTWVESSAFLTYPMKIPVTLPYLYANRKQTISYPKQLFQKAHVNYRITLSKTTQKVLPTFQHLFNLLKQL